MTKPSIDPRTYRDPVPMLLWAFGSLVVAFLLLIADLDELVGVAIAGAILWGSVGFWRLTKIRRFLKSKGY